MHRIETTPLGGSRPLHGAPVTPSLSDQPHRRLRSRAAMNLRGLCPVCGDEAERRLTASLHETRETYRCPVDGETVYLVDHVGRRIQVKGQNVHHEVPLPAAVRDTYGTGFFPLEAAV